MNTSNFFKKYHFIIVSTIGFLILILAVFSTYSYLKENKSPELVKNKSKTIDNSIIRNQLSVEVNGKLPNVIDYFIKGDDIKDFPVISYYKDDEKTTVDMSKLDSYTVKIIYQDEEYESSLNVVDKTPPEVTLKDLNVKEGERYIARNFIQTYYDNSKEKGYSVSYKDPSNANITNPGTYDIELSICDNYKNCTEGSTKLIVNYNNSDKHYIKSETETIITKEEPIKYGVKKITTSDVTYSLYDDGSREETTRGNEITEYDYSGFNRSYLKDMKEEAKELYNTQGFTRTDILTATNSKRREKGIQNLSLDPKLSVLAIVRAMEIAYGDQLSHERPYDDEEYQSWISFWREDIFDFNFDIRSLLGENVGAGMITDEEMIKMWSENEDDLKLMLDEHYTKTGVGKYSLNGVDYWVQFFVE